MDYLQQAILDVTERNVGAITAVAELQWLSRFPDCVVWLQKRNITGAKIYELWNDVHKRSGIQWCYAVRDVMEISEVQTMTDEECYAMLQKNSDEIAGIRRSLPCRP